MNEQDLSIEEFDKLKAENTRLKKETDYFRRDAYCSKLSNEIKVNFFSELKRYLWLGGIFVMLATAGGYLKLSNMINVQINELVNSKTDAAVSKKTADLDKIGAKLFDKTIEAEISSLRKLEEVEDQAMSSLNKISEIRGRLDTEIERMERALAPLYLLSSITEGKTDKAREYLNKTTEFNVNTRDSFGRTPLIAAADEGNSDIVKDLLEKFAVQEMKDFEGRTALIAAVEKGSASVVQELIKVGVDLDAKFDNDQTPLMLAAKNGYKEIVELLVNEQVDLKAVDIKGKTALSLADDEGFTHIVDLIKDAKENK